MIPEMEYRFVGRSGLQVSAISLGGWITYGGSIDEEKTFACLKAAYDAGINFFDCAEGYQNGESEITIGKAIKHYGWRRNDLVISTKVCLSCLVPLCISHRSLCMVLRCIHGGIGQELI